MASRALLVTASLLWVCGEAAAERLPSRIYTTEDGLSHNRVKRVVQDSLGFLWFCTADGLSRFDGARFTNYRVEDGLPASSINDLLETSGGVYWLATNTVGVVRFDLLADLRPAWPGKPAPRFTVYQVGSDPASNRVNVLYRDHAGALWAGTDGGLFRLDTPNRDQAFQPVTLRIPGRPDLQVQVWSLVEDASGSLWIGTKYGLVRRSEDGRTTLYRLDPSQRDDVVMALLRDAKGTLWAGHANGLIAFDPTAVDAGGGSGSLPASAKRFDTRDGLTANSILAVQQAADGRIWIRTIKNGLTIFDGETFRGYEIGHRITDSRTSGSMTADREGNIWIGTPAAGAVKVSSQGWVTYGEADGMGEAFGPMFENRAGELYVTSRGWKISHFGPDGFTTVRPGLPASVSPETWRDWSGAIQDHLGEWWLATREGLYRFPKVNRFEALAQTRPIAVYTTRDGLANDDLTRLFEDSRGDLWIGSFVPERAPVTRWERATNRFHRYGAEDGLRAFTSALMFAEDRDGSVLIGFREGGFARFRDRRFTLVGYESGIPPGPVNDMYLDPAGRLWLAVTQGGLCRIDRPREDHPQAIVYTTAQGLTSNQALAVTGDLEGRVYVAHIRGIDRIDPATGQVKRYSSADGLTGGEFRSALRDHRGTLWFCTMSGLSRLVPGPEPRLAPPRVLISAVRVNGLARPLSALGEPWVDLRSLGPDQNNVQVDFFGLDLRAGETLRYQYLLEGARSSDWSPLSAERAVNFASLASGKYRFLVRAVSADGTLSKQPALVWFVIVPPIWLRWWFIGGVAITLIATTGGFLYSRAVHRRNRQRAADALRRIREERLAELERVRKRIATDLHDDVGSSLTRISLLSEVVQQRLNGDDPALVAPLSSIAGLSRELVDSMSDIVWAINPNKDHLSDLSQRMRHFASDVFTARQVAFQFHTPDPEHDTGLGANVRRELFLVFKEAVNNVVRHSGCSEADLELRAEPNALVLRVRDNGRGFQPGGNGLGGHGLPSMRARTEGLGGQLEIVSEPGQGTTVTVRIPIETTDPYRNMR
jgi:signal transduction histidine kinase/ligand-binding sensor domain-containing protein